MGAVAVSLVAGLAVGAWLASDDDADAAKTPAGDAAGRQPLEERILSLEQLIAEERQARLALERQVMALTETTERLMAGTLSPVPGGADDAASDERRTSAEPRRRRDFVNLMQRFEERRLGSLVNGGFSEDEARRILRQESEAEFGAMQEAWEAHRQGEAVDPMESMRASQDLLRAELGDAEYERYLAAIGQPTSVQVTRVLDGSPASSIGLEPGDQIVSYDGTRVFDVADLRRLTLDGQPGEDVVIEIDRDGVRMQLSVPRGPVGISGSGARWRNPVWSGG
jgi:hypothetical protein